MKARVAIVTGLAAASAAPMRYDRHPAADMRGEARAGASTGQAMMAMERVACAFTGAVHVRVEAARRRSVVGATSTALTSG
ncbi:MAG TPA: hypothetical protein VG994_14125 [Steroidobacteraceae bacterium]|nr:hypothetical protein [Steroidobacteraceae bacterium]